MLVGVAGDERPRVAIVGVGAIGTTLAWALEDRADVLLCRRGRSDPMTIALPGHATERVRARTITDSAALDGPVDWVVIATKAHEVQATRPWLEHLIGPSTRVVVVQNGIDHADRLAGLVSADHVIPCAVYAVADRVSADRVVVQQLGRLALPVSSGALAFQRLVRPELPVGVSAQFETDSWRKLILNAAYNSLTALTLRNADVIQVPEVRSVVREILCEGARIARAHGIPLEQNAADALLAQLDALPASATSSMRLDREHGRTLEREFISGALLRKADERGVPAPTLRTVHRVLVGVSASQRAA